MLLKQEIPANWRQGQGAGDCDLECISSLRARLGRGVRGRAGCLGTQAAVDKPAGGRTHEKSSRLQRSVKGSWASVRTGLPASSLSTWHSMLVKCESWSTFS